MKITILSLTLLVAMLIKPSAALCDEYVIDSSHSQISFKIRHLGISTVKGNFNTFSGVIDLVPENLNNLKAAVSIKAESINTNDFERDKHLKSPDFFDVEQYPKIAFVSTDVRELNGNKFKLVGELTLHGVTKTVVLDSEFGGVAVDPWGVQRAAFTATTTIDRKEFGMIWNKALDTGGVLVGDEVKIEIELELKKSK